MNTLRNLCLMSAFLALSGLAHADTKPAPAAGVNCPMMGDTASMQKGMAGMMTDMSAMMKDAGDPALKARMGKMHEQMAAMMTSMRRMHGGMMGGGMMGGGMMQNKPDTAPATPPVAPDRPKQ